MRREHGSLAARVVALVARVARAVQLDLFTPGVPLIRHEVPVFVPLPVRARDSDPQPSHEAATAVSRHGTATAQVKAILEALIRHPEGMTADALDALLFSEARYAVSGKRLPEMEAWDLVERLSEKRATRGRIKATVWRAK